jgi:hypothetical protein
MTDKQPLRGDAAWRARKAEIARRNDAARKVGAERRDQERQAAADRRRAHDRRERESLPSPAGSGDDPIAWHQAGARDAPGTEARAAPRFFRPDAE